MRDLVFVILLILPFVALIMGYFMGLHDGRKDR